MRWHLLQCARTQHLHAADCCQAARVLQYVVAMVVARVKWRKLMTRQSALCWRTDQALPALCTLQPFHSPHGSWYGDALNTHLCISDAGSQVELDHGQVLEGEE